MSAKTCLDMALSRLQLAAFPALCRPDQPLDPSFRPLTSPILAPIRAYEIGCYIFWYLRKVTLKWTAGATVARLTPDQKVIRSNRVWFNALLFHDFFFVICATATDTDTHHPFPSSLISRP